MLNNHHIWGVMGAGMMSLTTIMHLPTVVTHSKGETVVRGCLGLSLGTKLEVEISQDFLLDTVTTANPLQLDTLHSVMSPPDISRCAKSVKQVTNTMWAPIRASLVIPLVRKENVASVWQDEESTLATATEYHPLALYGLIATRNFYENRRKGENVLHD